jgi:hypothetical protein
MWQIAEMDRLHVERIHLVGCSNIDIIDIHPAFSALHEDQ